MKNYYTKGEENIYRVTIQIPVELHKRVKQFANCYRGSDAGNVSKASREIIKYTMRYCFEGRENNYQYIPQMKVSEQIPYYVSSGRGGLKTEKLRFVMFNDFKPFIEDFAFAHRISVNTAYRMLLSVGLSIRWSDKTLKSGDEKSILDIFTAQEIAAAKKMTIPQGMFILDEI